MSKEGSREIREVEVEEEKGGGYDPSPRVLGSVFSSLLLVGLDCDGEGDRDRGLSSAHPARHDR